MFSYGDDLFFMFRIYHRHVLGDLEIGFNTLLEATESDFQCNLVTKNPFKDMVYNTKQAEAAIIFDVCALAEIGNTKNNLIGVSDLSCFVFVFVFEMATIQICYEPTLFSYLIKRTMTRCLSRRPAASYAKCANRAHAI